MSSHAKLDADVLVVGCGPVGTMAALRCAQRGLSVIAVDRELAPYPLPRAIGMDDEIQSLFHRAGLGPQLRAESTPMAGAEFVDAAGNRVVGIDLPPGTVTAVGYPPVVAFDQPGVERFLRAAATAAGVEVRLGATVTNVTQVDGGVATELDDHRGTTTLRSRWLLGADGARSTIRRLCNIELIDQQFDQPWLVVDTTLIDPNLVLPKITQQVCDPERITTFVPGHLQRRRWEFRLHPDETAEQAGRPHVVESLLAPWGNHDQLRVDRSAVYRFHATVAERFRLGSIFLAGDAAHQMPPFNGQGMCSGMRDAENLAWKLAAVNDGSANSSLLDSYDEERRPHVTQQVAHSVDAGQLIDAIAHDGPRALESGYGHRRFPGLDRGVIVGEHSLVGHPVPRQNDPAIRTAKGWVLVQVEAAETPVPSVWLRLGARKVHVDTEAFADRVPALHTVIVRPDGYVAAVTNDLATTTNQLIEQASIRA